VLPQQLLCIIETLGKILRQNQPQRAKERPDMAENTDQPRYSAGLSGAPLEVRL